MEYISITNDIRVAKYFEESGVDDIMVDLETLGKAERQKGLNTVISNHCIEDVSKVKSALSTSKCLVRINPINKNSREEINEVISRGADILMLPFFKYKEEVELYVDMVGNNVKKYLLLETPQALTRMDEIVNVKGIDAVHIGLNDLSIGMGLNFLYEPLIGGLVDYMAQKIKAQKLKFGFGGVSRIEKGRNIISEHFRLGSEMVILNRDFRFYKESYDEIVKYCDMKKEIGKINDYILQLENFTKDELLINRQNLILEINQQMNKL